MNKKLQVFVSSTYTDLIEERQAAVEAILDAGHIPAGMELFKAGDKSQLETIYKWIDECDIFMLILGGRYGSIEEKTDKSYTQLEYEYATTRKPFFSIVLKKSFLHVKASQAINDDQIFESKNIKKYNEFKKQVMSKIVKEVDSIDKISTAIHATLQEYSNNPDLPGWVRSDSLKDNTELLKENYALVNDKIQLLNENQKIQQQLNKSLNHRSYIDGLSYNDVKKCLNNSMFKFSGVNNIGIKGNVHMTALQLFGIIHPIFLHKEIECNYEYNFFNEEQDKNEFGNLLALFVSFDLLKIDHSTNNIFIRVTQNGNLFYSKLKLEMIK